MKPGFYSAFLLLLFLGISCQKNDAEKAEIIPLAPTDLTGKIISPSSVQLNWIDKSTNEKGFRIQRKAGSGQFSVIDSVGIDMTIFTDKALTPGTNYTYRILSYNSAGPSITYSNELTLAPIGLPNLTTIAIADTTGISATSGGDISNDGGSPILSRGVVWNTSPTPDITLTTKTSDATGTGVFKSKLTGLKVNTKYYVRAYATNPFYPFSGNAADSSGNGFNGTVNGATLTTDRYGNNSKAYSFDGSSNSITIPNFTQNPTQFSISLWFYPTANGHAGSRELLHRCNPTDLQSYCWNLSWAQTNSSQGNYLATGILTNNPFWNEAGANLQLNQWYHAMMCFDGTNKKVYLNGNLVSTTPILGQISYVGKTGIYIGFDSYWDWYQGKIDDIRIYNRALSQDDIAFLASH